MILTIAAKELRAMFGSPLAWIVLGLLQAILAWLFLAQLDAYLAIQAQLVNLVNPPGFTELVVKPAFESSRFILLMATPILAMRLIAEERRNQTMALLMSAPISMTQIAIGKFLGLYIFLLLIVAQVVLMALSLHAGGTPDLGLLAANALGLALLASCFAALGLFVSSLSAQPVAAAIGTLVALLASWLIALGAAEPDSPLALLAMVRHVESFNKGLIDSADLIWCVLFTLTFLLLSIRRLDHDRLHG